MHICARCLHVLSVADSSKRTVDVKLVIPQGRMTLLLGPPGSGKSTLLKALSGRLHMSGLKYHGEVRHSPFPVINCALAC